NRKGIVVSFTDQVLRFEKWYSDCLFMYLRRHRWRRNAGIVCVRDDDSEQEFSSRQSAGGNGMDSRRRIFHGRRRERKGQRGNADGGASLRPDSSRSGGGIL